MNCANMVAPLFPRCLQFPVPLSLNLLLVPGEHVFGRDVTDGAIQTHVVVMLYGTLNQTPRIPMGLFRPLVRITMLEDPMRFLKKCAALLGLLVAFSSFGLAVGKMFFPARLGVWVGPATGFVIGLPAQGPRERELLGDSFAPLFTLVGVFVGRSSWTFLHRLPVDGGTCVAQKFHPASKSDRYE